MARRITRKSIKHDEFVEGVDRAAHWLEENVRTVVGVAIAVVLVVVLVFVVRGWVGSGRDEAALALARGQAALDAAIVPAESADPGDLLAPTFGSEAERHAAALESFREAGAATWGSAQPLARLYEVIVLDRAGERASARERLAEVGDDLAGDPVLEALALGYGASMALEDGDWETAESGFRELAEDHPGYPRGLAQLGLGRALAGAGRVDEARGIFLNLERAEAGTGLAEIAQVHREALP